MQIQLFFNDLGAKSPGLQKSKLSGPQSDDQSVFFVCLFLFTLNMRSTLLFHILRAVINLYQQPSKKKKEILWSTQTINYFYQNILGISKNIANKGYCLPAKQYLSRAAAVMA